jgi:hypothetical protein
VSFQSLIQLIHAGSSLMFICGLCRGVVPTPLGSGGTVRGMIGGRKCYLFEACTCLNWKVIYFFNEEAVVVSYVASQFARQRGR